MRAMVLRRSLPTLAGLLVLLLASGLEAEEEEVAWGPTDVAEVAGARIT